MKQITIKNDCISLTVLEYGAIIQKLLLKNNKGEETNVVAGFEDPEAYRDDPIFLGACVGRFAGRISGGGFNLNGQRYGLFHRDGLHLHGGKEGFGKKFWDIDKVDQGQHPSIQLSYVSKHMEEGYPGTLKVRVTYLLRERALHVIHHAVTDRATVVNLTNHSYFQLDKEPSVAHYLLKVNAPAYLETKPNLAPTGKIVPVCNTSYDFLEERSIKNTFLDTPYVLDLKQEIQAGVFSPVSGISMKVSTNQPALVVYRPGHFPALCFEAQNFPDAPNQTHFPSSVLEPGESYNNTAVFKFDLVI